MTRINDDFDEFEFDDSLSVKKMLQEMRRDELRKAIQRKRGRTQHKRWDNLHDSDEYGVYDDDFDDYDDEEFDSYS